MYTTTTKQYLYSKRVIVAARQAYYRLLKKAESYKYTVEAECSFTKQNFPNLLNC